MAVRAHRYFSTLRPIGPGTFPKEGMISFQNYGYRMEDNPSGRPAWGYLDYDRQLSMKETFSYDLVYGGKVEMEEKN